jgi:hypothetical protein
MKKYFTIYLPTEGKITNGEIVMFKIDDKWTEPCSFDSFIGSDIQEVKQGKLFLCSRDIKVGDKFKGKTLEEFICSNITEGDGNNYFPKETLIWTKDESDGNIEYWRPKSECFKVIGQISPNALSFVKEGDEFEEYQISISVFRITSEILPNSEWVFIEGPCKHFH